MKSIFLEPTRQPERWNTIWSGNVDALKEYMNIHNEKPAYPYASKVGLFTKSLLKDYKLYPELRNSKRAQEIEAIAGWTWYSESDEAWLKKADEIEAWVLRYPDSDPPARIDGVKNTLYAFVSDARRLHSDGALASYRSARLDSIDGWSWIKLQHSRRESQTEILMRFMLNQYFPKLEIKPAMIHGKTKLWSCDAFSESLRLIIEYDGATWHNNEKDFIKTADLMEAHYNVFRLRELPLKKTSPNDVVVEQGKLYEAFEELRDKIATLFPELEIDCSSTLRGGFTQLKPPNYWDEMLAELIAYSYTVGHASPPTRYVTKAGVKLGVWVFGLRRSYRRKQLAEYRIKTLESLQGWRWDVRPQAARRKVIELELKNSEC